MIVREVRRRVIPGRWPVRTLLPRLNEAGARLAAMMMFENRSSFPQIRKKA
jgi:hypothetical protein